MELVKMRSLSEPTIRCMLDGEEAIVNWAPAEALSKIIS
jgi:hypothetical protein